MTFDLSRAIRTAEVLFNLGHEIYIAIAHGKPERVSAIVPDELLTTLERHLADARADAHFAAVDDTPL